MRAGRGGVIVVAALAVMLGFGGTDARTDVVAAVTYTDAQHESGRAPDVQSESIALSGGTYTVTVAVAGFPAPKLPIGDLSNVFTCFDLDGKIETGSRGGGCDYGLDVQRGSAPGESVYLEHWTKGNPTVTLDPPSVHIADSSGGFTLTFPASAVGDASSFFFYTDADLVRQYPNATIAADYLPDHGHLRYPDPQPAPPAPASGQAALPDPAGDGRGGVDLTNVTISDGPNGALTFGATVKGVNKNGDVVFGFDTDENATTGIGGREYSLDISNDPIFGWGYELDRWASGAWQYVDDGDVAISGPGTTITLTLPRHDLGGSPGFDTYAGARNFDSAGITTGRDDAPDSTWWRFTPAALTGEQLVRPVIGKPVSAGAPVAGRTWTVRYPVTRAGDGKPFVVTGVDGDGPSIAGAYLPMHPAFGAGFVRWKLKIPKSARGKTLTLAFGAYSPTQVAYTSGRFRIR